MFHKTSELFEFNKILFIYLISGAIASVWLSRMIVQKRIIIKNTLLSLPLAAFFLSQVLSTIFSIDRFTSFFGYYGRFNGGLLSIAAYYVFYLAFVSNFTSVTQLRLAMKKALVSSLLGSVVVIAWGLPSKFGFDLSCLVFTGKLNVACWTEQFKPTIRVFSTLGQPNWLGAYLAVNFFIGLYFLLTTYQKKGSLYMYAVYMFFNMLMLLYTRSRSSLLAVGVGMIVVIAYVLKNYKENFGQKRYRHTIAFLIGAFLCAVLVGKTGIDKVDHLMSFNKPQQETPVKTNDTAITAVITDSFTIRKIVWQGGYTLGLAHPLFGTGVETFAYAYNFVRPVAHNMTSEWDYVYNKAHNEFVNYFATTGFVGLGTYLILLGVVLSQIMHAFKKNNVEPRDKLLLTLCIGAYMSLIVTIFFGFSITVTNIYLYMLPAFIISIVNISKVPNDVQVSTTKRLDNNTQILLGIVGIFFLTVVWWIGSYWSADIHYAKGENLAAFQDYGGALRELYKAYNLRKEHVYADKISSILAQVTIIESSSQPSQGPEALKCPAHDGTILSCFDLVERYSREALQASPKNVYYYRTLSRNYILLYQAKRDEKYYQRAVEAAQQARDLAPTDPRYPYTLALFYLAKYENTKKPSKEDVKMLEHIGLPAADFALKLKTDYRDGYYVKGLILKQLGKKQEAKEVFSTYLKRYSAEDKQFLDELKML